MTLTPSSSTNAREWWAHEAHRCGTEHVIMTCDICGADPCINASFCLSCRDADARKPRTSRWYVYDRTQLDGAPQPTVEALMYSLRERGTKALDEAPTTRRLSELSEQQLHGICGRLQRLKPHIAPAWAPDRPHRRME